jgi:hypothetical protein
MRKLTLDPEQLMVESFATAPMREPQGTVLGAASAPAEPVTREDPGQLSLFTCYTDCDQLTCALSCAGTCFHDVTCNSCHVTQCATGRSPECCA